MTESEFLVNASGHFLTEEYPNEALCWGDSRRADYCAEHVSEGFEYFTGEELKEIIGVLSYEIKKAYQQGLQDARKKQD